MVIMLGTASVAFFLDNSVIGKCNILFLLHYLPCSSPVSIISVFLKHSIRSSMVVVLSCE